MNYVKTFESFIKDMEFPKDCEHCGEQIMSVAEESVNFPGMCLWCDSHEDDDLVDIVCTNCEYHGPMKANLDICPNCLENTVTVQPK